MPGKVTVKKGQIGKKPYVVQGDTLQAIWDDILKKGPKDKRSGKKVAGYTECPVKPPEKATYDGKLEQDKNSGEYTVTIWFKAAELTMTGTIQHPKLASDKKLSAKAKAEWKRFMKLLMDHENEHVNVTEKAAKAFAADMQALTGEGKDVDKEEAKKKAGEDLQAKRQKLKSLQERLDKANKDLDSGGHGPTLKTSIK
jgi:predicted secreted Zn-dependent protease